MRFGWRMVGILAGGLLVCRESTGQQQPDQRTSRKQVSPATLTQPIAELPAGFAVQTIATGLTGATAMAVAADGRVFVCEQTGTLRVIKDDVLLEVPVLKIEVDSSWERGLIGVSLDPDFDRNGFLYICYVAAQPYPHHRVSRWTLAGDRAVAGSETILLQGDDQNKLGGGVKNGHQGGAIHFGADGKLYIALGEQTAGTPAQHLDTLQGKLLRINPDGSIPDNNPFVRTTTGKYRAIWAYGLRNPFGFAVQPNTGRILINDVGDARWEEINEGVAGANYGWPLNEGPCLDARFHSPLYAYDRSQGKSITGGVFYNPARRQFPDRYRGKYFFAEFMDHWIRVLDPSHPKDVQTFATGLSGPVDLQVGQDGSLFVLNRNAWVKDDKFQPETGALQRIVYVPHSGLPAPSIVSQPADVIAATGTEAAFRIEATGKAPLAYQWFRNGQPISGAVDAKLTMTIAAADDGALIRCVVGNEYGTVKSRSADLWTTPPPQQRDSLRIGPTAESLPHLLSETGVFANVKDLTVSAGVLPYEVNSPLWSDGADKRRWIILPADSKIGFAATGPWKFPAGTVFVKHFEFPAAGLQSARRIETRLLVLNRRGHAYGATYRWRHDGTDAELLDDGLTEPIDWNGTRRTWTYPTRNDCLICHTANAGVVLGANTRQLNRACDEAKSENILLDWGHRQLFDQPRNADSVEKFSRLVALNDETASFEVRARSYLDANCAHCHRPGGTRAEFDARWETPLAQQKLINTPLMSSDLGVAGAKTIVAGNPERSMLYRRMKRGHGAFDMPPLATHVVDDQAVKVMSDWIQSLTP